MLRSGQYCFAAAEGPSDTIRLSISVPLSQGGMHLPGLATGFSCSVTGNQSLFFPLLTSPSGGAIEGSDPFWLQLYAEYRVRFVAKR